MLFRSDWRGGYDRNIYNLCAWHAWKGYLKQHPEVASVATEMAEVETATRSFYLEKTSFHAARIRRAIRFAKGRIPEFQLGALPLVPRDALRPEVTLAGKDLLERAITRELVHEVADLVEHDARMMEALAEAEGAQIGRAHV